MLLKKKNGFTLIELMVAIAIVAIISTVGIVVYSTAQKSARVSKRVQDLTALKTALELYKSATGVYPIQNGWACIANPLSVLTPNYMPVLTSDPLDNGAVGGANCYQYTTGAAGDVTTEYKVRTNPSLASGGSPEMPSTVFAQQPTIIDPAKDGTVDCIVQSGNVAYSGWAVSSGSTVCDD